MTLRDHLYELRHRLGLAILIILAGAVLGFLWFMFRVGPIPSLGDLIKAPYCALEAAPAGPRFEPEKGVCTLLQTRPFEAFMMNFKIGLAAGMVLTAPLWLYQVWAFITPGLYARERRFALTFVGFASVLFAAGAVLAYLVLPKGLEVLVSFGGSVFTTALAADQYVSFLLALLLIFGVSFELPLLIVMLNRVGVLPYANLKKWRRGLIFGIFVFAAFATPGTDPISMSVLAASMTVLFELAVQLSRVHDRRKARREAAEGLNFDDLADDEATPLDRLNPEPVPPSPPPDARAGLDDVT
ncbi:MAG TPA: twin-arginine translocase subunit TatC [Actinophytocola sp.]|uniref:twin-arginine translocase subunit TatC n=1 Tax=Actinophytocola sp. TaxID=1872138 RepID=UPI002DDDA6C4|nr:twin-arginine translocase subunit TatC [Actinophytocola sp.]HEV2783533.1 twin-arginine translocase subunit TatC [Actinophytocola sp.]